MTMTLGHAIGEPGRTAGPRRRSRRRGRTGPRPPVPLRTLAAAVAPSDPGAVEESLRRVWISGFCAGAASVAPDRVKRCPSCGEPFVAGHLRAVYCGPRCRNTVMKRRYRARLRARGRDLRMAG